MARSNRVPKWIYQRNLHLAQHYYDCIKTRTPENARKAAAVRSAYDALPDDTAREFIRQNLFNHVRMQQIDLPISHRTMLRLRSTFVYLLAERMGEL